MKLTGTKLAKRNYKQLYRITGDLGILLVINFCPTNLENIYLTFHKKFLFLMLFRRTDKSVKYGKACYMNCIIYEKNFYQEWSKESINTLLEKRPGILTHEPLRFSSQYYDMYRYHIKNIWMKLNVFNKQIKKYSAVNYNL